MALKKKLVTLSLITIIGIIAATTINLQRSKNMTITVGYPGFWGPLIPAQQCTAYGDSIISNQFESLVKIGPDHLIHPLAAKSWTVSNDFKVYTFKINTSKKFSNGEHLSARHFKESWEYGIKLESTSHNKSTLEILTYINGYKSFSKKNNISGIQVINDETLKVSFNQPYRLALDNFAGGRMAAFIKKEETYLGTGRFILNSTKSKKVVKLTINPYHPDSKNLSNFIIKVVNPEDAKESLRNGDIDAFEFAFLSGFEAVCKDKTDNLSCTTGLEFGHYAIEINIQNGRFFENPKYRRALLYMISSKINNGHLPETLDSNEFTVDQQVFLNLQKGRLDNTEKDSIIKQGKQYINEMVKASASNPIRLYSTRNLKWLIKMLEDSGIVLSKESGKKKWEDILKMQYKTSEMDLYLGGFSVANGDPGGLYHKLGKTGAILAPMTYNERVGDLLEEGKSLIDHSKIDEHYKKINSAILEEVPIVHLGFVHGMSVYRNDKVKNIMDVKSREENRLHFYRNL